MDQTYTTPGQDCGRWAIGTLLQPEDGFLDVAVPRVGVGVLGSDDDEARFLEDSKRGDVVAGRPGVQWPGRNQHEQEFQGLAGDSASPRRTIDPVGDLDLVPGYEAGDAADKVPVTGDGPVRDVGRPSHPGHVGVEG